MVGFTKQPLEHSRSFFLFLSVSESLAPKSILKSIDRTFCSLSLSRSKLALALNEGSASTLLRALWCGQCARRPILVCRLTQAHSGFPVSRPTINGRRGMAGGGEYACVCKPLTLSHLSRVLTRIITFDHILITHTYIHTHTDD